MVRRGGLLLSLFLSASAAGAQGVRIGSRAPEIALTALSGERVRLSELRGHPVVITFWATWCPPCREEFPALVEAYRRHEASGLRILAVNQLDQELHDDDVRRFLVEFPVPFPVLLDRRGRSRRDYRLLGLPTMVFIDTAGIIRGMAYGPHDAAALDRRIAGILTAP